MTTIEQLLGDLLLRHNCVIIPSFGGFVAKQVSARVDFDSGKMFPPRKSLLFNKQLINNDGLLINELAQANQLSYESAKEEVNLKVEGWNQKLKVGERIEIDKIGMLFLDAEKNLCFEQDRFFNLLLDSYGLGQVHFISDEDVKIIESTIAIKEEQEETKIIPLVPSEERVEIKQKETVVVEQPKLVKQKVVAEKPAKRKVWRYVAAACILPIAFYSVWIPMKTDMLESGVLSLNDFNPFHQRTEGIYSPEELKLTDQEKDEELSLDEQVVDLPEEVDVYTYQFKEDIMLPVELEKTEVDNSDEGEDIEVSVPAIEPNAMHYIVGCFGDKTNADNLVNKLRQAGMDGTIVGVHNGLHRVSAGAAISLESLAQIKEAATGLGLSGWTLK